MLALAIVLLSGALTTHAGYEEGFQAARKGDYTTAFREFKANAEKGDVAAQYSVAVMYNDGIGVKKNPKEARFWFRKAAENGHPMAIEILKRNR